MKRLFYGLCLIISLFVVVGCDSILVVDDIEPVLNKVDYSTEQSTAELNGKTYHFYQKNDDVNVKFEIVETHYDLQATDGTASKPLYAVTPDLPDEMKPSWAFSNEVAEAIAKFPGKEEKCCF